MTKKRITKLTGILIALLLTVSIVGALSLTASAAEVASGTVDGVSWMLSDDGTLTYSGNGEIGNDQPWIEHVDLISAIVIEDGITAIGNYAFYECNGVTSVTFPTSMATIGNYAFSGCSNLESVTIPASVTKVGNAVFDGCSSLMTANYLGKSEPSVGSYIFSNCSLTEVNVPTDYEGDTFAGLSVSKTLTDESLPGTPCEHSSVDSGTGICAACGEMGAAAKLEYNGAVDYYATLTEALAEAEGIVININDAFPSVIALADSDESFTIPDRVFFGDNSVISLSDPCVFSGDISLAGDNSVISGGIYTGKVISNGKLQYGTFMGDVTNNFYILGNCTFYGTVTNNGTIEGGIFNGTVINNGNIDNGVGGYSFTLGEDFTLSGDGTVICGEDRHLARTGETMDCKNGCALCGELGGHSFANGACTVCGTPCDHAEHTAAGCACGLNDNSIHIFEDSSYGFCTVCGEYEEPALSAEGYYEIDNAGKLYWLAAKVNGGSTDVNAVLTSDITVNQNVIVDGNLASDTSAFRTWTPIGNESKKYSGTFIGNGKKISGLYYKDGAVSYVGLFGYNVGVISGVGVVDSYFYADRYIGGISGCNTGEISNCFSSGSYFSSSDDQLVLIGGIAGNNYGGNIERCYNTSTIKIAGLRAGGIAGSTSGSIIDCYNTGDVITTNDYWDNSHSRVAGIAGQCVGGLIANCYNAGKIEGNNIGAITTSVFDGGIVRNCYNNKDVFSINNTQFDSLVDSVNSDSTFADSASVSTSDLAAGGIAYLLNAGRSDAVWGQKIGTDIAPVLGATDGNTVYRHGLCTSIQYVNESSTLSHDTSMNSSENFNADGTCKLCGAQMEASLTASDTLVVSYYQYFEYAITAAASSEGSIITLLSDVELPSMYEIEEGTYTIDLCGMTIFGERLEVRGADITIIDSSGEGLGSVDLHMDVIGGSVTVRSGSFKGQLRKFEGELKLYGGSFIELFVDEDLGTMTDVFAKDHFAYDDSGNLVDVTEGHVGDYHYVKYFTVKHGAHVTEDMITTDPVIYNGEKHHPSVKVTVGGIELVNGVDYFIVELTGENYYRDAGEWEFFVEFGINTAYTADGNKCRAVQIIEKATLSESDITVGNLDSVYVYNTAKEATIENLPEELEEYHTVGYMKNGSPLSSAPVNAGTYQVLVFVSGSPNYNDVILYYDMIIAPIALGSEQILIGGINEEFVFNRMPHEPTVYINLGQLFVPTDEYENCTVTYEDNIESGLATVIISGNYSGVAQFEIKKAIPNIELGAPVDKVMAGYVMNVEPTCDALDSTSASATLTVLDGEGYSVLGNRITIDEGVVIGETITVLVEYSGSTNYERHISEHILTVGLPTIDTSELEGELDALAGRIAELESEFGTDGAIEEIKREIEKQRETIEALDNGFATDNELLALATRIDALEDLTDQLASTYATKSEFNDAIDELNGLIDKKADAVDVVDKFTEISDMIKELEKNGATDAELEKARNELTAAYTKALEDEVAELEAADKANADALTKAINDFNTLVGAIPAEYADVSSYIADVKAVLTKALDDAVAELEAADKANTDALTKAINDFNTLVGAIPAEYADVSSYIADVKAVLTKALDDAVAELEAADKANADELEEEIGKVTAIINALDDTYATDTALAAAIAKAESELKTARADLEALITKLDGELKAAVAKLDGAIAELKAAMEKGDADLEAEIKMLNSMLITLKSDLLEACETNKAELTKKIEEGEKLLREAIGTVEDKLELAVEKLEAQDKANSDALAAAIEELNAGILAAKSALAAAAAADKEELEGKITSAEQTLKAAIDGLAETLDATEAELLLAISTANTELNGKIDKLNEALEAAKTALLAADAENKVELEGKIKAASETLDAAIKSLEKALSDAKAELEAKDAELEAKDAELEAKDAALDAKDNSLNTFITVVCIISCVTMAGTAAFVIWFFIDRKKRI